MNTVVGLDISKGKSHVQAFLESAFLKTFKVAHTLEGINKNVVFFNIKYLKSQISFSIPLLISIINKQLLH
ncbi:hypothetical protein ABEY24_25290 [Peribacillus frigoritolerans]|uniref:hypothetical protein n=1 Tax=Peribacillus frigoritolerans TaxID=450367 RepID=UPI003D2B86A0